MGWAILDTAVYVDHWERGLHQATLAEIRRRFVIRHSAVVLSELRRGARTRAAREVVDSLRRVASTIWEPSASDWWEAARLIRKIGDARDWNTDKRREFQNDALIALTARRHGATVVTSNAEDFRLIAKETKLSLVLLQSAAPG
jgi:predicted nucleic acid-binding protein